VSTRRTLLLGLLVALLAGAGVAWTAPLGGGEKDRPAVVATFDDASYLVAGQDVRIAGAIAGKVQEVRLTRDRKARVALDVAGAYLPFRSDARCTIRPQSLIGERYIDCSPGTPAATLLPRDRDGSQRLPVERTSAPIDLDLVLDTLDRPVSERLALILVEFGSGLAGRGSDLNEAIHRASPALQDANRLLDVLDRDRARIGRLVTDTDTILAGVGARRAAVPRFIRRAGATAAVTARRRAELGTTIRRLPKLLRTSRGALAELRGTSQEALPVVRDLRAAAPGIDAVVAALPALARAGTPAVAALGRASRDLRPAARALRPGAAAARPFAALALPTGRVLDELATSLREKGATRGLLTFLMNATLATSRYDTVSHVLTATQFTGSCSLYATTPDPACDAHFAAGRPALTRTPKRRGERRAGPNRGSRRPAAPEPGAAGTPPVPALPSASTAPPIRLPGLPPIPVPDLADTATEALLGYLLG